MERLPAIEEATSEKLPYFISAFSAAALWGFMSIPLRAIQAWPAEYILLYRILASMVLVWAFIFFFRRKQLQADLRYVRTLSGNEKKKLIRLIIIASVLITCNWFTYIYAVNNISVQSAAFAYMICPLLTTVLSYFILKEQLTPLKKAGLIVALISALMLGQGSMMEVVWSISVAMFYALYLIVQRIIQRVDKLNLLAIQITISSILTAPFFINGGASIPEAPVFWFNILVIAIVFTIIPLYLSMYALNGISSSTTGILIYINPIIAFFVAVFYFHEPMSLLKFGAYGILMIAVGLFNWEFLQKLFQLKRKEQIV